MIRIRWLVVAWIAAGALLLVAAGFSAWQLLRDGETARELAIARERDDRTRLALWRMDALLVPMLAAEQSRPWSEQARGAGEDAELALATARISCAPAAATPPELQPWLDAELPPPALESGGDGLPLTDNDYGNRALINIQVQRANRFAHPEAGRAIPFTAAWHRDRLALVRRHPQQPAVHQILELDLPALRQRLRVEIADLLPDAELVSAHVGAAERRLAALPLALDPGSALPGFEPPPLPFVRIALTVGSLLVAALALAALAAGTLALARRRSAFTAAVTHELRTPLTTLRLYGELLEQDLVPEEERRAYLSTLRAEADRLGRLVEEVLAFARLEGRRCESETVDLAAVLGDLHEDCATRVAHAGRELRWTLAPDLPPVRLERSALRHILANLLDNALKYGGDGAIELGAERAGDRVVIALRDYGSGLPHGRARALFKPFRRGDPDGATPGIGLGLALCRELARRMGGELRYRDAQPGARFELLVPMAVTR